MKTMIGADSCLTSTNSLKKKKKKRLLREVMVKIRLKQKYDKEGICYEEFVMICLDINIFLFLLSIFLNLIFLFF